jgi:hypothetical protein
VKQTSADTRRDSLPAENLAGNVLLIGRDQAIPVHFSATAAMACGKFPAHDGQGSRILPQGIFC